MKSKTKVKSLYDIETLAETEENKQNLPLIEREAIEGTPFYVITENGYSFGIMGEYRLTERMNTPEEVKKELESITWNRVIQVTALLIEKLK